MRNSLLPAFSFFLILPFLAFGQVVEPKNGKKAIVPATVQVKGCALFVIDASKATGAVLFRYDKKAFGSAIEDGKKLYLVAPKVDEASSYTVTVISFDDKSVDDVVVTVSGDKGPTPVKPPVDQMKAILDRLDKLEKGVGNISANQSTIVASQTAMIARLVALEQVKPQPPPTDPFQAAVQVAYEKDGKNADAISKLTSLYKLSGPTVNDPTLTTKKAIHDKMHAAAQLLIADALPNVRRLFGDDDNAVIGKADGPADATARALIASQFLKHQKALEGVVR